MLLWDGHIAVIVASTIRHDDKDRIVLIHGIGIRFIHESA